MITALLIEIGVGLTRRYMYRRNAIKSHTSGNILHLYKDIYNKYVCTYLYTHYIHHPCICTFCVSTYKQKYTHAKIIVYIFKYVYVCMYIYICLWHMYMYICMLFLPLCVNIKIHVFVHGQKPSQHTGVHCWIEPLNTIPFYHLGCVGYEMRVNENRGWENENPESLTSLTWEVVGDKKNQNSDGRWRDPPFLYRTFSKETLNYDAQPQGTPNHKTCIIIKDARP